MSLIFKTFWRGTKLKHLRAFPRFAEIFLKLKGPSNHVNFEKIFSFDIRKVVISEDHQYLLSNISEFFSKPIWL